jgi:hypothetical protein
LQPVDDGFQDYEAGRTWQRPSLPLARPRVEAPLPEAAEPAPRFAGWEALSGALAALPAETRIVLVFPPRHVSARPAAGSPDDRAEASCKRNVAHWAEGRANVAVVDVLNDDPRWADPGLFWDATHVRRSVAVEIEDAVAAAIRDRGAEP